MANYPNDSYENNLKIPPQNIEAEESLLGCALTSEDARAEIVRLDKEDFYQKKNGLIYQAIIEKAAKGEPIDILSVADFLESEGTLEAIGGISYLTELADKSYLLSNVAEYADMVKEKSRLRKLLAFVQKMEKAIYSGKENADNLINLMASEVVKSKDDLSHKDLMPLHEILNVTLKELRKSDSDELAVDSGFPNLNKKLGRLRRQTLNILAARPAMGKSAFALNLALNVALKGKTVAIFSLEMSKNEVGLRLLSSASTIATNKIKEAIDTASPDANKVRDAVQVLATANIYIDDSASTSPADIRAKCNKLMAQAGLDLVVIDYLQLIGSDSSNQNRQQEISEISRALKIMARDLNVPVIALSQLSRGVEMRENKRPMLSDLRESGAIEQDADAVMFLYRDSYYNNEELPPNPDEAELILAKNRQGTTGTIKLNWFSHITTFREQEIFDYNIPPENSNFDPNFDEHVASKNEAEFEIEDAKLSEDDLPF